MAQHGVSAHVLAPPVAERLAPREAVGVFDKEDPQVPKA